MFLDIKAVMNDDAVINLEMQVNNYYNWPERSMVYASRCLDNLKKGEDYSELRKTVHIGFLDFTLFPEEPEFFATNMMMNVKTNKIYTDKLQVSVVDLTKIGLATEEDKYYHRDMWAAFFKSGTWEEILMLAKKDEYIAQSVVTVSKLSEDEEFKLRCEAREDHLRNERDMKKYFNKQLAQKDKQLAQKDEQLTEKDEQLAEKDKQIAELLAKLKDK